MPEPDPSAAIRTPPGATPASGGLLGESPPFPVPDHTLIRRVGRGAYGEVWLARNTLGTWRAVKFIRRSSFDDDRPFERELAGIQRFEPVSRSHESQLNILHVGRAEDGFFYVMELADDMGRGQEIDEATYTPRNLRSELHVRGRLPAAECLRIGLALTTALEHLHKHGLVHRDIKPSNIVFVNGIPKLADIGLVARAEATISFVGTEGFLPPEGPGTRPADIYSLGKVLYEISTGHDRQQFPELPTNIVELPDRAQLSELNEVLLKACHRDPQERYQTAAEMHADLALLESGRSVVRMRGLERSLRFAQRAGAVVTVIAALAAGLYLWQARQTKIVRNLATEKSQLAEEKSKLAVEKSSLAEANREQLVRLRIANGVRLLDEDDPSAALLWFAEALPLVTNKPSEEAIHLIRIQQVLDQSPRLVDVVAEPENVQVGGFSPDGENAIIGTGHGRLRVWNIRSGQPVFERPELGGLVAQTRFTLDGRRLLLSSSPLQGNARVAEFFRPSFVAVLDVQTGKEVFPASQVIPGMSSNLFYSVFSPDDRWLAVARSNHVVQVLDAGDGHLVTELRGHTDEIRMLNFSADSSLLVSASHDQTARLWRVPSGEPVGPPIQHHARVERVELSADGSRLATATRVDKNFVVQTWDVRTGHPVGPPIPEDIVFMLAFAGSNGNTLITGDGEFRARVYDADTHLEKFAPLNMGSHARCWDFSPDGRKVAIGCSDGAVRILDLETGEILFPPFRHTGWVESVHFSPDGLRLLTTSDDRTAKLWNLSITAKTPTLRFEVDIDGYHNESWGRRPGPLIVPLKDNSFCLVDAGSLREVHRLKPSPTNAPPYGCQVGPLGRSWAVYGRQFNAPASEVVDIWHEQTNGLQHLILPHGALKCPPIFSPDETRLLTCNADRKIRIWRTSDGTLEETHSLPEGRKHVYEFLSDAKRALTVLEEHVELMEIASQRTLSVLSDPPFKELSRDAIDQQDARIAVLGGQSGCVIDLTTGKLTSPPFKQGGDLLGLDFSPDGRRIITAGLAPEGKMWDTTTGELLLQPFVIGRKPMRFACWSADGRFIAARSDENVVRVWDASTAEAVTPLLRHEDSILWVGIASNHRLVTVSKPNLLRAWDLKESRLPPDVIADYARLLSGRRLSASGTLLPLEAEELAELSRSLRTREPQLFE